MARIVAGTNASSSSRVFALVLLQLYLQPEHLALVPALSFSLLSLFLHLTMLELHSFQTHILFFPLSLPRFERSEHLE